MTLDSGIVQAGDRDERRGAQHDPRAEDHGPSCCCWDCRADEATPEDRRG